MNIKGIEIERKYVLKRMPLLINVSGVMIHQGYIHCKPPSSEIRVRRCGYQYLLTTKSGYGLVRTETEVEIPQEVFDILWDSTESYITKIRTTIGRWEIDLYTGDLMGLYTAEIELETEYEEVQFPKEVLDIPKFEVTNDERFKNKNLSSFDISWLQYIPFE